MCSRSSEISPLNPSMKVASRSQESMLPEFLDAQAAVEFGIPALGHVEIQNAFVLIQNAQLQRIVSAPGLDGSA